MTEPILQRPLHGHHVCPGCNNDMDSAGEICPVCFGEFVRENGLDQREQMSDAARLIDSTIAAIGVVVLAVVGWKLAVPYTLECLRLWFGWPTR